MFKAPSSWREGCLPTVLVQKSAKAKADPPAKKTRPKRETKGAKVNYDEDEDED